MTNLDTLKSNRTDILNRFAEAIRSDNAEMFNAAFGDLADNIAQAVNADFEQYRTDADARILAARGIRQLTSHERDFYNALAASARSDNPMQALTDANKVLPETVISSVFDDIKTSHPLLWLIDYRYTGGLTKMLLSTTGGVASWGALGTAISSELSATFIEVDLTAAQLTAYIPVPRYIAEMGAKWIDSYVRELLTEAIATQLEAAIVDGTGKNQPIGMARKLSDDTGGVFPQKTVSATLTSIDAVSLAPILATLSTGPNGTARDVSEIVMVVNPTDYFGKVFPATTVRSSDGTFNSNVFPFPTRVVRTPGVPSGKAIFGLAKKYFFGAGTSNNCGKIEYSDHAQFLGDNRVYKIRLFGNGRATDENAFVLADISGLEPYIQTVQVISEPASE